MGRRPGATAAIEPAVLPEVHLARDYSSTTVARRVRDRAWVRVGRGIYMDAPTAEEEADGPALRRAVALGRIVGTHARLSSPVCFSHQSAALVYGLPQWNVPRMTHLTVATPRGAHCDPRLARHIGLLSEDQVTVVNGLHVTSLARTVADCLTTMPPLEALVVADSALHRGLLRGEVEAVLAQVGRRNGSVRASIIAGLADDGAESPAETGSRFVLLRDGFPIPSTQVEVSTRLGSFWADLGFEEWQLLMEYDGRRKYAGGADKAFFREKERHHAVLETGNRLLRVVSTDLRGRTLTNRLLPLVPRSVSDALRPRRELMT